MLPLSGGVVLPQVGGATAWGGLTPDPGQAAGRPKRLFVFQAVSGKALAEAQEGLPAAGRGRGEDQDRAERRRRGVGAVRCWDAQVLGRL